MQDAKSVKVKQARGQYDNTDHDSSNGDNEEAIVSLEVEMED